MTAVPEISPEQALARLAEFHVVDVRAEHEFRGPLGRVRGSTLVPLQLAARWRLSHVELPICLVFGEEDTVVDIRFARLRTAGRHNAELRIVPHAPHRVVTHEGCHAVVADFVARTAATSRRTDARLQEVDEQAVAALVGQPGESGA